MAEDFDSLLDGRLKLRQPEKGHRAGTDAVLLAAAMGDASGHGMDIGAGVGTVGLAIALHCPLAQVTLVELAGEAAGFARENIGLNGLEHRAWVAQADVLIPKSRRAAGLVDGQADFAVTNPPFFEAGRVRVSGNAARAGAHVLQKGDLVRWIAACLALVRPGGVFAMIHRPDSLPDILEGCAGRMGGLALLPVYARADQPAIRLIVRGRKGSRAPLRLLPGLVLHQADGAFTARAEAIHRGREWLVEL